MTRDVVLCQCNCGLPAPIASETRTARGWVKGQPIQFRVGHYPRQTRSLAERFAVQVDWSLGQGPEGTCYQWIATAEKSSYGQMGHEGKIVMAHRVAWFLAYGTWPTPCALHSCDNPPCCNVEHLFEGTQVDNMHDMWSKGRGLKAQPKSRGELSPHAKLTEQTVREIRALHGKVTQRELAKRYGVSLSLISHVQARRAWAWLS